MVTAPIMEYDISINNQSIAVNSENPIRASFNPPFNIISGTYKSTNISLSRFEIRITAADADFDIDLGTRPYYATANISANSVHEFSFEINEENFNLGNTTYRISLYARSALDGTWDVTNVLFDLNGLQLDPSDEFDGIEVYSQKEPVDPVVPYLSFIGNENFTLKTANITKNWNGILEYSTDKSTWKKWNGIEISSAGSKLYLRGTGNTKITGNTSNYRFVFTGTDTLKIACKGNIENLLDYETVSVGNHPAMADYCYYAMFYGCTFLTTAPELPATTLTNYCYDYMFYGCTSLITAPELPATTLTISCYDYMFYGCTSLITAPELPATTLADYCYQYMFTNCTSLTIAPELPATTLAERCYDGMFYGCKSLTKASSVLPATTLATYCYASMFRGCTSLTTVPELPATTLATYCYQYMFNGCTSLTTVPELSATTLTDYCYQYMFENCKSLTTAPELPATTLATCCYQYMFQGCTSLTSVPALPATTLANRCYSSMFSDCTALATVTALPATKLALECYRYMFKGCTNIKLSKTQAGEYQTAYRIPTSGTGTAATDALNNMFTRTGGTFKATPEINTTYYTSNTVV